MSNALAIPTVTASLAQLLEEFVNENGTVPGTRVTTLDPRSESLRGGDPIVNVFLYRITPNPALNNQGTPTHTPSGGPVRSSRLAVSLDYLISFFGDDATLEPQRLLGSVVPGLHAAPILTAAWIARTIAEFPWLAGSDLAQSDQPVRFTLVPIPADELRQLFWARDELFRLSVAYQASGVELDWQPIQSEVGNRNGLTPA